MRPSDSLLDAVARDDVSGVQRFIQAGADLNAVWDEPNSAGSFTTALAYAVNSNSVNAARLLLANGVDANKPNPDGQTPLLFALERQASLGDAVRARREQILDLLLQYKVNVNLAGRGDLPLGYAISFEAPLSTLSKLISAGALVKATSGGEAHTSLFVLEQLAAQRSRGDCQALVGCGRRFRRAGNRSPHRY